MKQRRRYFFQAIITVLFSTIAIGVNLRRCTAYRSSPFRCRGRFSWSQYQKGAYKYDIGTFEHIDVSRDSMHSTLFSPMSLKSSTQIDSPTSAITTAAAEERSRLLRVALSNNRSRNRRKPPLIDSDLLRFLNTTQTLWNTNDDNGRCSIDHVFNKISDDTTNTTHDRKSNETTSILSSTDLQRTNNDNNSTDPLRSNVADVLNWNENGIDDQMMKEWMNQYECTYIVALLHQKYGAALEAAYAVGTTIERIALSRTQQKRMRSYCKLRNQIWKRGSESIHQSQNRINLKTSDDERSIGEDVMAEDVEGEMCDIIPFSIDCSNHNNMDEIVNVMMEYGLSSKDICEILMLSPSIAFMQPRTQQRINSSVSPTTNETISTSISTRVAERTQQSLEAILDRILIGLLMGSKQPFELNLRKYDARKVLRNTPGILTVRGSETAYQIIQLLINLGVSTNSLSRDKNNLPILLSRQPNDVFRLVAFLSSDAVRMPVTKIGPLLRRTEGQDLLNAIAPSRANMIGQRRVLEPAKQRNAAQNIYALYNGLLRGTTSKSTSPAYVATQIQKVVVNDIYRRMSETAWTLRNKIGTSDLGRVIAAYPSVLLLDASRQILPTAQYLMNELDILPNDLPSILQLYPALLRTDVEQMRNVVSYLTSLAVAEDNLSTIFRSFPVLLTLDIEHDMEPVVEFLQSIGVSNVGRFISRLPPILGYSVENELRPKFDYLNSISSDARFKITKFPAYFSYPLERVIKSRFEYLRNVKRIPTPLLSLDHILCSGDKDFATKVCQDTNVTQYARFIQDRQEAIRTNNNSLRRFTDDDNTESIIKQGTTQQLQQSSSVSYAKKSNSSLKYTPPVNTTSQNEQPSLPSGTAAITS